MTTTLFPPIAANVMVYLRQIANTEPDNAKLQAMVGKIEGFVQGYDGWWNMMCGWLGYDWKSVAQYALVQWKQQENAKSQVISIYEKQSVETKQKLDKWKDRASYFLDELKSLHENSSPVTNKHDWKIWNDKFTKEYAQIYMDHIKNYNLSTKNG